MPRLDGFTLFHHPQRKSWQMSTRREGEPGWEVQLIPDERAAAILSTLDETPVRCDFETELSCLDDAFVRLAEAFDGMA